MDAFRGLAGHDPRAFLSASPPLGTSPGTAPAAYSAFGVLTRSDDDASSFYLVPFDGGDRDCAEGQARDAADLPPSAAFPEGRIVVAVFNGMGYNTSDEGYTCSPFWQPFRWGVHQVEVHPDPAHPFGGTVYAVMRDFGVGFPAVYASEDGGESYAERETFLRENFLRAPQDITAAMTAEGAMVLGMVGVGEEPDGTLVSDRGKVIWSGDGGRTWTDLTPEGSGWGGHGVLDIELGRDGRVYVATYRGVWRTTGAVSFPVASAEPPEASGLGLTVAPNPASGEARVVLRLASPEAEVRVSVYDARGREVWSASGARGWGEHEWAVPGLAPGTYVVRARVDGEVSTARFTVVR